MTAKISIILFFFSLLYYSQNTKLLGIWILDKYEYKNGKPLEVNNRKFSVFSEYQFFNNKMIIDGVEIPILLNDHFIKTSASKINYVLKGDYLLLNFEGDETIAFLLRPEKFAEKYQEFQPKQQNINGKIVYLENEVVKPEFIYLGGFNSFFKKIFENYTDYPKSRNSFKIEFTLTKDSKITDLKVINSISNDFDKKAITEIKNSEILFKNTTGKDFIFIKEVTINNLDKGNNKVTKNDKLINKIDQKAFEYYNKNDFENAIKEFEKLKNIASNNLENNGIKKQALIRLGVSYLALNKINEACVNFNLAGNLTDFSVRNYLINFCAK